MLAVAAKLLPAGSPAEADDETADAEIAAALRSDADVDPTGQGQVHGGLGQVRGDRLSPALRLAVLLACVVARFFAQCGTRDQMAVVNPVREKSCTFAVWSSEAVAECAGCTTTAHAITGNQ